VTRRRSRRSFIRLVPATVGGSAVLAACAGVPPAPNAPTAAPALGSGSTLGRDDAYPFFLGNSNLGKRGSARLEYATLPAGGTLTLLNLTEGPGYVSHLWNAISCSDPLARERTQYRIYVDGEATPSVSSTMVGFHAADAGPNSNFATRYVGYSHSEGLNGYYAYLPIPFTSSIRIDLVNGSGGAAATAFAIADYHLGVAPDWGRLRKLHTFEQIATVAPYAWQDLLNVSGQARGILWGVYLRLGGGDGNLYFLEGNLQMYLDGATSPSYQSSGTEDYFNNAWYFQTGVIYGEHSGCTRYDPAGSVVGAYRFHRDDPVPFENALHLRWQNGTADQAKVVNPTDLRSHVWYYTAG
jgi:Protein of unknown function (DUF2961)